MDFAMFNILLDIVSSAEIMYAWILSYVEKRAEDMTMHRNVHQDTRFDKSLTKNRRHFNVYKTTKVNLQHVFI